MTKGAFTPEFTPVARPGNVLRLDDASSTDDYVIERFAPLPDIQESITVAANDRTRNVALDNLEMWRNWLGQYRLPRLTEELPDGVEIEVDQGGNQMPAYQNVNYRGSITNQTPYQFAGDPNGDADEITDAGHLLELFVFEDEVPRFTLTNTTAGQVTVDLTFAGFGYGLKPTSNPTGQPVYVPIEAVRGE